jgi:hypothetical protein
MFLYREGRAFQIRMQRPLLFDSGLEEAEVGNLHWNLREAAIVLVHYQNFENRLSD